MQNSMYKLHLAFAVYVHVVMQVFSALTAQTVNTAHLEVLSTFS